MISLTLSTAFKVPLPKYLDLSPSLNSTASKAPVDAPDGTAARPTNPPSTSTSTSTVGFPLESNISLAYTDSICKYCFIKIPPITNINYINYLNKK